MNVLLKRSIINSSNFWNFVSPIFKQNCRAMNSNGVLISNNNSEDAKKIAAVMCVDEIVKSGTIIGVGTGSTAFYAIERVGEKFKSGELTNIQCIPSSFDSRHLLIQHKLPVTDLEQHYNLDVYIDGADEVDQNLTCIKGGGGCLTEEKIVMSCARKFYVIADFRKRSVHLGQHWPYIPVEVCRSAHVPISRRIEATEGGVCKLRSGTGKAGPVVTDNGNFILDWHFPKDGPIGNNWHEANTRLLSIPGIVETGLFPGMADKAYFGMEDGTVTTLSASGDRVTSFKKAAFL